MRVRSPRRCRCGMQVRDAVKAVPAIPAITMIDAGAPPVSRRPKNLTRRSGVKCAAPGNRPGAASLSQEGRRMEGETSRRKKNSAQAAAPKSQDQGTRGSQQAGPRNPGYRVENAPEVRNDRRIISGSPAGCSRPPPDTTTPHRNVKTSTDSRPRKDRAGLWPYARAG